MDYSALTTSALRSSLQRAQHTADAYVPMLARLERAAVALCAGGLTDTREQLQRHGFSYEIDEHSVVMYDEAARLFLGEPVDVDDVHNDLDIRDALCWVLDSEIADLEQRAQVAAADARELRAELDRRNASHASDLRTLLFAPRAR